MAIFVGVQSGEEENFEYLLKNNEICDTKYKALVIIMRRLSLLKRQYHRDALTVR